jgi:subtilisin family serine protease
LTWALLRRASVWLGLLACLPAAAQTGPGRGVPGPPSGGGGGSVGIQFDLGTVFRALRRGLQSELIATVWPPAEDALAAYSLPAELVRQPTPDGDFVCEPGELLVFFPSAEAAEPGVRELRDVDQLNPDLRASLPALGAAIARYPLADNEAALVLRERLRQRHPDWAVDLNARSESMAGPRLYAFAQLQLPVPTAAANQASTDSGTHLGVIDGPTDAQDSLLTRSFSATSVLLPGEVPAATTHGNSVARLIAGKPTPQGFAGVAPGLHLHWATVTRLVQGRERSNTLAQVLALDWQLAQQVHIVNISMGGPSDAVLAAAYRRATAQPVVFVAAAGNSGPQAAPLFPAAYPGVLAVTAIDALGQVYAWANQGDYISLAAPGVDLWVPVGYTADGTAMGQYLSGTSMATALASGMLARWGAPRLRQAHAEKWLPICKAAQDLGVAGKDPVFGCGMVR